MALPYRLLGKTPERFEFVRNGKQVSAVRAHAGYLTLSGSVIVTDPQFPAPLPLPVRTPSCRVEVLKYQWAHPRQLIDVCLVIPFRRPRFHWSRKLRIKSNIRPDLTEGVIVDSGEISLIGEDQLTFVAGLGDGYYPVIANYNFGWWLQSIVVDFLIWQKRNVILFGGQQMDEYGIVVS